jgi:hypothetical protein
MRQLSIELDDARTVGRFRAADDDAFKARHQAAVTLNA